RAVAGRPPEDRVLRRERAEEREERLRGRRAGVARVREGAVVARGDGEPGEDVEREEERQHPPVEADVRGVERGTGDADDRRHHEENDIDPVFFAGCCVHSTSQEAASITPPPPRVFTTKVFVDNYEAVRTSYHS